MIKLEGEFMKEKLFITPEYTTAEEIRQVRKGLHLTQKEFCRICQLLQTDGRALGKERRGNPGTNCSVVKNVAEISGI